jgi:hypothetical protein
MQLSTTRALDFRYLETILNNEVMNKILHWTGFGERVEFYCYVDGKIFYQYAPNKLDFGYHCRGGERKTEAEVAISVFKVVDATPGQEPLLLALYSIPSNPVTQCQIFLRKEVPNNLVANTGNIFLINK